MQIRTERLLLKPLILEDAGELARLANDWEVAEVLARIPHPYSEEDALQFIDIVVKNNLPAWGIHTDRFIGVVGIDDELGYWLGREFWGKGYMTEAAAAVVSWFFEDPGNLLLNSGHFTGNQASRNVLTKLGFEENGNSKVYSIAHDKTLDQTDMVLSRERWEQRQA